MVNEVKDDGIGPGLINEHIPRYCNIIIGNGYQTFSSYLERKWKLTGSCFKIDRLSLDSLIGSTRDVV